MNWFGVLLGLLVGTMGHLQAQPVSKSELDIPAQQRQVDAQRNDLARQTQDEERTCYDRFAVNDCLKAARLRSLEKNAALRRQQESLNDFQRQRDGAEKIRQLEERKLRREQDLRDAAASSDANAVPGARGKNRDTRLDQPANALGRASNRTADSDGVRSQSGISVESQQVYQRKQQDAERRRQERDKRIADKAGSKRSAPLPAAP